MCQVTEAPILADTLPMPTKRQIRRTWKKLRPIAENPQPVAMPSFDLLHCRLHEIFPDLLSAGVSFGRKEKVSIRVTGLASL
jgi:hypothetical protein